MSSKVFVLLVAMMLLGVHAKQLITLEEWRGELSERDLQQRAELLKSDPKMMESRLLIDPEHPEVVYSPDRYVEAHDQQFCHRKLKIESCPATPVEPTHIPEGNQLEVWSLQAPVFEEKYGPIFGKLGLYHVAIGLRDLTSGTNYTVEYDAWYEVPNATFPHVVVQPDGSKDLVWCNEAMICRVDFINDTYWDEATGAQYKMGTINGTGFNTLMDYIKEDNVTTHKIYELWTAKDKPLKDAPYWDTYMNSSTCDDFNFRALYLLQDQAGLAPPSTITELPRDWFFLFTHPPVAVDYNTEKADIIRFYEDFQLKDMTFLKFLEHLLNFEEGNKYLYVGGTYYRLAFHEPYVYLGGGKQRVRP